MQSFSLFWSNLAAQKGAIIPRIAFADSTDPRILQAVTEMLAQNLIHPLLIGNAPQIQKACQAASLKAPDPQFIRSVSDEHERNRLAQLLVERQKKQNLSLEEALKQLDDPLYLSIALLLDNKVDGLVAGSLRPTADVVKAAIRCVGPRADQKLISGHFLIESQDRLTTDQTPFLFADCAVMPEPSARSLAAIALGAAASYEFFTGKKARVALLSFSTRGSAGHELVDRIREALAIMQKHDPSIMVDGELQVDAALDPKVAKIKNAFDSKVAGSANVFVFPNLEAGNIGYKLVQRFSQTRIAGPILWGLNKPMSDLSRGCSVQEIKDTALCVSAMARSLN